MDPSKHEPTRAQNLRPIPPGTQCLIVQDPRNEADTLHVGRTVTANRRLNGACPCCGQDLYVVAAPWLGGLVIAARVRLQPLLPPGIDDQVTGTVDDRADLEVA